MLAFLTTWKKNTTTAYGSNNRRNSQRHGIQKPLGSIVIMVLSCKFSLNTQEENSFCELIFGNVGEVLSSI